MMNSTDSTNDVKAWLLSMVGKMIEVLILQKAEAGRSEQMVWKGRGKVLRCVLDGAVLDLNSGGRSWWSRFFKNWHVTHVAPLWIKKPVSIPYFDLSIHRDSTTGEKQLVIDAATWSRSPEELAGKGNFSGISQAESTGEKKEEIS